MLPSSVPLLVIGAGPAGLAVGIAAAQRGLGCVLLERRTIVSTIERYPLNMTFFSTPEKIEIGGIPLVTPNDKPTRRDGLVYYRRVAEHYALDVRQGVEVTALRRGRDGGYLVDTRSRLGEEAVIAARAVVLATGYFDNPNLLRVPGEELPHVRHYFLEGHHYWHQQVTVIGGGNSAVDAALECWRAGARVTLVHLGDRLDASIKAWVLPDITNRITAGEIAVRWRTRVRAITPTHVELAGESGESECLPSDAVLAMTGYHADTAMLRELGVPVDPASGVPAHDERTMETTLPGLYLAGVVASGNDANRLFIENTRHHGEVIVARELARAAGAATV